MADPTMTDGLSKNPNQVADIAIANRDVGALTQIAKDNIGTPASDVALRLARTIEDNSKKFNQMVAPIEKAGGPATPDGRVQIANTFQTVADNPQWGTALLKYVMGDKMGAVKQVTGGDITKKVTYDNNGDQILETHNALGEPISYFDRKANRPLSQQEYAERVGGISSWENTLKGMTEKKVREESAGLMVKEENQANNWYQLLNSHRPLLESNYNDLKTFKSDIDPTLYNKIVGAVSQSMGQANAKSNNISALKQLQDSLTKGESVKVDERLISSLRLNPKLLGTTLEVKGDQLVSKDNSFSVNANKLNQMQETDNISSESTKNVSGTMASIAEAERLGKLNPVQAQRLRRVIETSQQMGREWLMLRKTLASHPSSLCLHLQTLLTNKLRHLLRLCKAYRTPIRWASTLSIAKKRWMVTRKPTLFLCQDRLALALPCSLCQKKFASFMRMKLTR